jgi:hypothetical protein
MWEREASLNDCANEAWHHLSPAKNLQYIQNKFSNTLSSMRIWSRENFGAINREIRELKKVLADYKMAITIVTSSRFSKSLRD